MLSVTSHSARADLSGGTGMSWELVPKDVLERWLAARDRCAGGDTLWLSGVAEPLLLCVGSEVYRFARGTAAPVSSVITNVVGRLNLELQVVCRTVEEHDVNLHM